MDNSTKYGNAIDFDVDLHSIYAAYLGQFEAEGLDWWDKSWGGYFGTFNDFLGFGWEVMIVVNARTGRSHIAVRRDQIALFAKMIRTRFGESLAKEPPTTLPLSPVPTRTLSLRRLIIISDLAAYRKLALTLPAAELSHLRHRARNGDVGVAEQLFYAGGPSSERERGGAAMRDNGVGYTFACVKTTWWDKGGPPSGLVPGSGRTAGKTTSGGGKGLVLEVGIAVVRCANLRAVDVWPPIAAENYRKSHFITEEWIDKRTNLSPPSYPRAYAFGRSQFIADKDVERIIDANLAAISSPENDSNPNTLVLLTVGEPCPLPVPAASMLPSNILHIDVLAVEYNLLRRAQEAGLPGAPDRQKPLSSLGALLQTLQIPVPTHAPLGNAGNEAYFTLLAFQKLMMAETRLPDILFQTEPGGYPHAFYPIYGGPMMYPAQPFIPPQAPFAHGARRHSSTNYAGPTSRTPPSNSPHKLSPQLPDERRGSHDSPVGTKSELVPSTLRQPGRATLARSSTVFWDDSDYADAENTSPRKQDNSLNTQKQLRPIQTSGNPPSSMRHQVRSSSSRTVSWSEGSPVVHGDGLVASPRHSVGSGSLSGGSGPASRDQSKDRSKERSRLFQHQEAIPNGSVPVRGILSSGSSLKLDSGSSSEGRSKLVDHNGVHRGSTVEIPATNGAAVATNGVITEQQKERKGAQAKAEPRMKSEKSMKNVAGALARFWVG